jgi:hypothetical protein
MMMLLPPISAPKTAYCQNGPGPTGGGEGAGRGAGDGLGPWCRRRRRYAQSRSFSWQVCRSAFCPCHFFEGFSGHT